MTPAEIVSAAIAVLGLVGGAIGFFRSRKADKASKSAADEAGRASERSIAASEAAARAQERIAAAIESQGQPNSETSQKQVVWRIDKVGDSRLRLTNVGNLIAQRVHIEPSPTETQRLFRVTEVPGLEPGEGLDFTVVRTLGGPQVESVYVTWDNGYGANQRKELRVR